MIKTVKQRTSLNRERLNNWDHLRHCKMVKSVTFTSKCSRLMQCFHCFCLHRYWLLIFPKCPPVYFPHHPYFLHIIFLGTLLLSGPTMRSPGWSQRLHSPSPKICDSGSFNFPKRFGSHRSLGSARLCAVSPIFIPERPHVLHFCRHLTILLFLFQQAPQKLRNGIFLFAISKNSPFLIAA